MNRATRISLVALMLTTAANAQAGSWRLASAVGKDSSYFVDVDSVRRSGDLVTFDSMTVFVSASTTADFAYSIIRRDGRCTVPASSMVDSYFYDANRKLLEHDKEDSPMTEHKSGTKMGAVMDRVCGNRAYDSQIIADPVAYIRGPRN